MPEQTDAFAERTSRPRFIHFQRVQQLTSAAALAFAVLGLAGSAHAQQTTPVAHWTVTPFAGFGFSGDLDSGTGALGAAGGYVWNPRVSFEGEFTMLPSSEFGGLVEVDSRVWSVTGNLLYHFAERPFVPYGVFGIGFGRGSVDIEPDDPVLDDILDESSTEFVVNFGGGVQRQIRDRVAFRGDLRYFFGGDFVPDYWRLTAGLTFDLGRQ
jgi:opacity protein-like surface antigen